MSKSIAKNWAYNILLQLVNMLLPIITVPYISRVLKADGVGINSFTLATTQYFILVGTLGISMYGNRQIAYCRDDKEKMSKTFWSIYALNLITTSISLIIYLLIFGADKTYGRIYIIQSLNIVASVIDITWLYMGLEDFKKTVTRNMVVKIIGVIAIFIFVKTKSDLSKYVFINAIMIVLGNAVMWMYIPKTVNKIKITFSDVFSHLIPTLMLFVPQIAIQVYAVLDKTMLGLLSDNFQVGIYEQSQKIIRVILALVTSLGTVMLPRMSNLFANNYKEKMDEYLNKTLLIVSYVSIPMAVGIAAISKEFSWFFGPGFGDVTALMVILSPILFFIAMSNITGTQYLLPANRTNEFTFSVTVGAIVNVILNFIFISRIKAVGACIATLVAEIIVTTIQFACLRENIRKKKLAIAVFKYFIVSMIMYFVVRCIGVKMGNRPITTIIQGITGCIVYIVSLTVTRDNVNNIILNKLIVKLANVFKKSDK